MTLSNIFCILPEGLCAHHVKWVLNGTNFSHTRHVWSCWFGAVSVLKLCSDDLQSFHDLWVLAKKEKPTRVVELYNLCLNDNNGNMSRSSLTSQSALTFEGSLRFTYLDDSFFNSHGRQIFHKDPLLLGWFTRLSETKLKNTILGRW